MEGLQGARAQGSWHLGHASEMIAAGAARYVAVNAPGQHVTCRTCQAAFREAVLGCRGRAGAALGAGFWIAQGLASNLGTAIGAGRGCPLAGPPASYPPRVDGVEAGQRPQSPSLPIPLGKASSTWSTQTFVKRRKAADAAVRQAGGSPGKEGDVQDERRREWRPPSCPAAAAPRHHRPHVQPAGPHCAPQAQNLFAMLGDDAEDVDVAALAAKQPVVKAAPKEEAKPGEQQRLWRHRPSGSIGRQLEGLAPGHAVLEGLERGLARGLLTEQPSSTAEGGSAGWSALQGYKNSGVTPRPHIGE